MDSSPVVSCIGILKFCIIITQKHLGGHCVQIPPTHARDPRGVQILDSPLEESYGRWQGIFLLSLTALFHGRPFITSQPCSMEDPSLPHSLAPTTPCSIQRRLPALPWRGRTPSRVQVGSSLDLANSHLPLSLWLHCRLVLEAFPKVSHFTVTTGFLICLPY